MWQCSAISIKKARTIQLTPTQLNDGIQHSDGSGRQRIAEYLRDIRMLYVHAAAALTKEGRDMKEAIGHQYLLVNLVKAYHTVYLPFVIDELQPEKRHFPPPKRNVRDASVERGKRKVTTLVYTNHSHSSAVVSAIKLDIRYRPAQTYSQLGRKVLVIESSLLQEPQGRHAI
jgi:hypothetical protein